MQLRNRRKNHILFNVTEYAFESPLLLLELMICKQIHSYTGKYSTPLAVKILYDSVIIAIMWGNIVISGKSWSHGNSNQSWSMIYFKKKNVWEIWYDETNSICQVWIRKFI